VYTPQLIIDTYFYAFDTIAANSNYDHYLDLRPATWMWTDCPKDSAIWKVAIYNPTDTTNTIDPTTTRIIYKCIDSPDPTSVLESTNENRINAFPNPTNSRLNFSSKISGRLFDLLGNEILDFNQQTEIDISPLTKGVYFLKTNDSVTKVIKK